MTEAEWLTSTDARRMLMFLGTRAKLRKPRLFAVACCRQLWFLLHDERTRQAVDCAERLADGQLTRREWKAAADATYHAMAGQSHDATMTVVITISHASLLEDAYRLGCNAAESALCTLRYYESRDQSAERLAQAVFLRDIFGNPFRPVAFNPAWRTDTALSLARQMYDSRDFGVMPILADALQDAGCDNEDILSHCRDANATHVRGCWVVDLVLGKE